MDIWTSWISLRKIPHFFKDEPLPSPRKRIGRVSPRRRRLRRLPSGTSRSLLDGAMQVFPVDFLREMSLVLTLPTFTPRVVCWLNNDGGRRCSFLGGADCPNCFRMSQFPAKSEALYCQNVNIWIGIIESVKHHFTFGKLRLALYFSSLTFLHCDCMCT